MKQTAGKAMHKRGLEAEGKVEEMKGKAEKKVGEFERKHGH
jgi:uncharacterized protein YjbJ (UPF0337 family)